MALDADVATIDIEAAARAPAQTLSVEPNVNTRLTSGTGHATSTVRVPLHGLVPTGRTRATVSTLEMETETSVAPLDPVK